MLFFPCKFNLAVHVLHRSGHGCLWIELLLFWDILKRAPKVAPLIAFTRITTTFMCKRRSCKLACDLFSVTMQLCLTWKRRHIWTAYWIWTRYDQGCVICNSAMGLICRCVCFLPQQQQKGVIWITETACTSVNLWAHLEQNAPVQRDMHWWRMGSAVKQRVFNLSLCIFSKYLTHDSLISRNISNKARQCFSSFPHSWFPLWH